ncbi:hypothetical protein CLOSTMETH_00045 [[Clostridium] methylpentosum DSM 5476]|uniref:Uncharacterized protein n=1 Tax=[Clostridium] methylpentosum DSM 5476 TaxID=537013 RepID=C0E873_9FIRM|nr:hypothetical protein CLOSTMETH_00045 [[Clostridium] methylpentosum DSM 5476]
MELLALLERTPQDERENRSACKVCMRIDSLFLGENGQEI